MALTEYMRKRHFQKTPEPSAKTVRTTDWSYVIQKHDASRLHYDFRLELDGVLKSWAVPKGPCLDPGVKRLAVEVEDHPVAYGGFEGIIPEGEYGGGTVMLWDSGSWKPIGDPHEGFRAGKLKFCLHGQKLQGDWMLLRTHRSGSNSKSREWLLIKERDEFAKTLNQGDILEEMPLSVVSSRNLDAIANSHESVWTANKKSKGKIRHSEESVPAKTSAKINTLPGAKGTRKALPAKVDVELATLTETPPEGDEWLHEIKFDGYRMICRIDGKKISFLSRNHQDWTSRMPNLIGAAGKLRVKKAILDGEVVVMKADGTTDFQALQNAFREGRAQDLKYFVFDILYLDGQSLVDNPLLERKQVLEQLLATNQSDVIHYSEHVAGAGKEFQQQACRLHLEGIISKRIDQPYRSGRGYDWLKVKCLHHDEFVIGGFTEPTGSRTGLGALLVGFYDKKRALHYAGKVGTGFDEADLKTLTLQLRSIETNDSPFSDLTRRTGDVRTAHWVEPSLVGQFQFASRTRDGKLRHASFQGLREDKSADEVQLDKPVSVKTAMRKSGNAAPTTQAQSTNTRKHTSQPHSATGSKTLTKPTTHSHAASSPTDLLKDVRLTHPEKDLYPDNGITKLDLAKYYDDISEWILPHLRHRPVVLVRCPEGQKKECFYQKHPGKGTPDVLRRISVQEKQKTEDYLVVDNAAGLIGLVQLGALELHVWGSREDKLDAPDRLIFDLDPAPDVTWKRVIESAKQIRDFLTELGLDSFVKTTGGKGLHLVVPIDRRHDWDDAKSFCKLVAETIVSIAPSRFTASLSKAARPKKIFLDYLRNARGATSVVPYSTRARTGATVSVPLAWDELDSQTHSNDYSIRNVPNRLKSLKRDPWIDFNKTRQSLAAAIKKLQTLSAH